MSYTLDEGEEMVRTARSAVELASRSPFFDRNLLAKRLKDYNRHQKIIVKLLHKPTGTVIGVSDYRTDLPNGMAVVEAALSAARKNRDINLTDRELGEITVEVYSLSEPQPLPKAFTARVNDIDEKKDGIMVVYGTRTGILLPEDSIGKGKIAYLEKACEEAGLPGEYWKQPHVNIYKIGIQHFVEKAPNGKVVQI